MSYQELVVTAFDGRSIDVATSGDPGGRTVFYHHGSPGSSSNVQFFQRLNDSADLYSVGMSRPGYAHSTRLEGRDVAAVVGDVRVVLDALGRHDYVAFGWSGGGPHSLACAALDPSRCRRAVSLAGVAPVDAGFDWTEGMGPENVAEFALSLQGGPAYEAMVEAMAAKYAGATSSNVIELFGGLLSDVDKRALADEGIRKIMASGDRAAFANGWRGYYDDDRAFVSPWGFDPTSITVPVTVWWSDDDLMVPPSHGAWLVEHVPGANGVHFPSDGHISLWSEHLDELGDALSTAFGE